jgi:hypothetical protein
MNRDRLPEAERRALASALKLWPSPSAKSDGVDTVRAALDDAMFLRQLAANLFAELQEDGEDDAPLAKLLRDRVFGHIRNQPDFEQNVGAELADMAEREQEQAEFEYEAAPTYPHRAA